MVQSVQAALAKATASADFKDLLAKSISRAPPPAMPSSKQVQDEYASNARVIKEGGIKAE